ncbi:GNAT family N-acetyltransferase [Paraburkholderia terricola]|uniref:GNAT superfamily N-acetyltransferase n=1 Tax=Paraburkholderia terricola TaxID=169427 RepID=A0ABU1LTN0_9BURK|nr:GNAT family N-acetyltransferase [Paraburkholderia terricola]MDR6410079.1 GNAT superfamily N-acetyltransferase [Paraburkholderia terricola]MDR6481239.1 GNAT superfamily N-acetyltransferase [Paraburkholderia terricola]
MIIKKNTIEVLDRYNDVAPFVPLVNEAADSDKGALGFYPSRVFMDFARKEQLLVAVEYHATGISYAGHLLFEAKHPKGRVRQIFVAPAFRKRGIATRLLDHLKKHLTDHAFISMYARVAEDLSEANKFWHEQGFYVQSIARGGETRNRTIIVRTHELDTPQLFAPSGLNATDPLGLNSTYESEIPLFLLDLNVLFDLGPRRRRNEEILDLFRIERTGSCKLALSTEITTELTRTASIGVTDQMQAYARIFPSFPTPTEDEWTAIKPKLAAIVFPERYRADALSKNDVSDLRHLATAIQNRLTGLITNDASILNAGARLYEKYGIQVISPAALKDLTTSETQEQVFQIRADDSLSITSITRPHEVEVHRLLSGLRVPPSAIATAWAAIDSNDRVCNRHGVWSQDVLVGYLMWPRIVNGSEFSAHVAIDESRPGAILVAKLLLGFLIEQATAEGTSQIRLTFPPQQARIREVASALGFGGLTGQTSLVKLALGRIVTQSTWARRNDELFRAGHVRLPDAPLTFRNVDQQIRFVGPDGNVRHVSLMTLETLLSPALFCLPGRTAVISPVRHEFAEDLLAHSRQKSLLPHARARLYKERHYVSGKATLKHFKRGNLILFYESARNRGLGAIVAIARVQHAYLKSQEAMNNSDLDPSVLDAVGLEAIGRSRTKTVTVFDNIICLERPVPLATLQRLDCGSPQDLLTTHVISDAQLQEILEEGFAHGIS